MCMVDFYCRLIHLKFGTFLRRVPPALLAPRRLFIVGLFVVGPCVFGHFKVEQPQCPTVFYDTRVKPTVTQPPAVNETLPAAVVTKPRRGGTFPA